MDAPIKLRRWRASDAAWYADAVRDPEILRWTTERAGITAQEVRAAIIALPPDALAWVVLDHAGRRVGNASITVHDGIAEPAYWVVATARGQGIGTATLRGLTLRSVAAGAGVVEVVIASGNVASGRVAEKSGFRPVGRLKHPKLGESIRYRFAPS